MANGQTGKLANTGDTGTMSVYILLFRGINLGGNKIVPMEKLRRALGDAGFGNVATYIQSGNVVLTSDGDEAAIAAGVTSLFDAAFGFSSRPTVRSLASWRRLVAENPYSDAGLADGRRVHAVILDAAPTDGAVAGLRALATTEQIDLRDGVLYLYTPDGYGVSTVAKALDKLLKVPWTARNWNTVLKLLEMAEGREG
jgi:uncharacterized protein (DUF1697 family)